MYSYWKWLTSNEKIFPCYYEKAFDYARVTIITDIVQKRIGSTFAKSLGNMYSKS